MLKARFLLVAQEEFDAAFDWYAQQSSKAAKGFRDEVVKAAKRAQQNPWTYASIDRRHKAVFVHRYPYRIIYRIENDSIVIVAVSHTKQRPSHWRGR